jgi:hypothetical protein
MKNWLSIPFVAVILSSSAVVAAAPAPSSDGARRAVVAPNNVNADLTNVAPLKEGVPQRINQDAPPAGSNDVQRYAERERSTQGLQKFKGGDGVSLYIGGSALAIALFIVLLIIIL